MSWEAKKWAESQNPGNPNLKYVLIGACEFSNKRNGKISASAATIAQWCNYTRPQSVSGWLQELGEIGLLINTGERSGVSVVWMPSYWAKNPAVVQHQSNTSPTVVQQSSNDNVAPVIGKAGPNPITYNFKPSVLDTMGSTLDSEKRTGETQSISSFLDDDKSLSSESSAKEGKLFAEFQAYCYSKGGEPTKKGYRTWKLGQANRHKGFVLRGKFFTRKQAEAKARDNPEIMLEMRPATKINGKVRVLE